MDDVTIRMCKDLRKWVNHPKNWNGRFEKDLVYFDTLWEMINDIIYRLEDKTNLEEFEKDFIQMVKYEGFLYRVHQKYDKRKYNYGIKETEHFVSWTKTKSLDNFYWLHSGSNVIFITAKTSTNIFGIDIIGLSNYLTKYAYSNYTLGTPALLREQEIVFPILFSHIIDIEPNKD